MQHNISCIGRAWVLNHIWAQQYFMHCEHLLMSCHVLIDFLHRFLSLSLINWLLQHHLYKEATEEGNTESLYLNLFAWRDSLNNTVSVRRLCFTVCCCDFVFVFFGRKIVVLWEIVRVTFYLFRSVYIWCRYIPISVFCSLCPQCLS